MATTASCTEIASVTFDLDGITLEDLNCRHRRERKDLQAKIQALKKNAPKSDKKKRKEAMEEVARMESDLENRHAAELKAAAAQDLSCDDNKQVEVTNNPPTSLGENENDVDNEKVDTDPQQRVSKAQKRRDKKEREARQRQVEIFAAAEEAQYAPKAIEAINLQSKLKERQLSLHQIPSDGDCLYNAVRHQLLQSGLGVYSVQSLREETANYIRANKDALICYMTHPRTGELLDDAEFSKYCDAVQSTPAWGGQIELKALSAILKVPIEVLQAEGPPTIQGADEFAGPNLTITYHRHLYSLGEHYNSTLPLSEVLTTDNDDEKLY